MTANDVYVRMMKDHLIQKEWKPKAGDISLSFVLAQFDEKDNTYEGLKETHLWLPSQEQWQEKYAEKSRMQAFNYITNGLGDALDIVSNELSEKELELMPLSELYTILWCLFVSHEVYGLTWDWEESKWKKS